MAVIRFSVSLPEIRADCQSIRHRICCSRLEFGCAARPVGRARSYEAEMLCRQQEDSAMPFQVPPLPYAFNALEPHIDAKTMEIHHDKHHAAYVTNLNKAVEGTPFDNQPIEQLLRDIAKVPE